MSETMGASVAEPAKASSVDWVRINFSYFKTPPGMIKLLELLLGIICMACASPPFFAGTHWFLFVAVISFIATLIWTFVYLLSIREALTLPINWILTEVINTGLLAVLYLVAFIVQLSVWSPIHSTYYRGPNIAAGVFGLFNTIAYAVGTYLLYTEWRASTSPN